MPAKERRAGNLDAGDSLIVAVCIEIGTARSVLHTSGSLLRQGPCTIIQNGAEVSGTLTHVGFINLEAQNEIRRTKYKQFVYAGQNVHGEPICPVPTKKSSKMAADKNVRQ